ncbi:DJ-1/PfpI family protein [Neobacillus sp. 179-J 1A1 HS]|uniref:DJ-1/PfpI family protein n=1 Tax=Neobacillus driksii TaxID=3035913 RepID=UPI0035BBE5E5
MSKRKYYKEINKLEQLGFSNIKNFLEVLSLKQEMNAREKVIVQICHDRWVLVSAKILNGKKATGHLENGMIWKIQEQFGIRALSHRWSPRSSRCSPYFPHYMREFIRILEQK